MVVLFVSCKEDVPAKLTSSMGICILLYYLESDYDSKTKLSIIFSFAYTTKREVGSRGTGFLHSTRCEGGVEGVPFLSGTEEKEALGSHRRKSELHSLLSNSRILQTFTTGYVEESTHRKTEASFFSHRYLQRNLSVWEFF